MTRAFDTFTVEQCLRVGTAARLDLPSLDALQIKGLRDLPVIEKVLHHEQISLRLRSAALEVADLDRVKPKELRQDRRLVRRRLHILEIRRPKVDQHLPATPNTPSALAP